ncbi:zinc finger C3H1 domain-containing protein-like [Styela clava]
MFIENNPYFRQYICPGGLWMQYRILVSCGLISAYNARNYLEIKVYPGLEVQLDSNSRNKLDENFYSNLHADLDVAIKNSSSTEDPLSALQLLREKLRLEISQQKLDTANSCNFLCKTMTTAIQKLLINEETIRQMKKKVTDISMMWADVLVKKGDSLAATQVFEEAVTENPSDAKLCYEAALFQLNQESSDIDAALLYFETCASAYLKIDIDVINLSELKKLFHYLLRLSDSLTDKHLSLLPEISWKIVGKNKAYLWMIYIVILDLSSESVNVILDYYEKAIVDVGDENDRRQIWLRYLLYRQHLASKLVESTTITVKMRQIWLKNFTAVIRRCITTCSPDLAIDELLSSDARFYDYTFHNQVASIYLSCFHTRQHISTAYNFLTDLMPYNVPLLLRACRHFLSFGDDSTIVSILWRITSTTLCQNMMIWKM